MGRHVLTFLRRCALPTASEWNHPRSGLAGNIKQHRVVYQYPASFSTVARFYLLELLRVGCVWMRRCPTCKASCSLELHLSASAFFALLRHAHDSKATTRLQTRHSYDSLDAPAAGCEGSSQVRVHPSRLVTCGTRHIDDSEDTHKKHIRWNSHRSSLSWLWAAAAAMATACLQAPG